MILDTVNFPRDLKKLGADRLYELAGEVRKLIIETVAERGGHLSPSLGTVELTIALLRAFDPPEDSIIWDVGHQSYAHKILTGRKNRFDTLRTTGGLSPFPKSSESIYDAFDTGHSSTSISAGLGLHEGDSLQGKRSGYTVSVIGDGAMTSGLAFEGLNNAGHLKRNRFIVVLNDNEMSISPNVGALSSLIGRKLVSDQVMSRKRLIKDIISAIPLTGDFFGRVAHKLEGSFKGFITPGALFEAFGMEYVGPIDGHDIDVMLETFANIKKIDGSFLVHVVTKKGRGYRHAEALPCAFHGVERFNTASGEIYKGDGISFAKAFGLTLTGLAAADERIIAITAAMTTGTGLEPFSRQFPERFFDVGIAESHAVTFAAGLAKAGMRPFVTIYSTFFQRSLDQVIHDVALTGLPVIFCIDRAGLVGEDGATHQGMFDLSFLRCVPGLTILAPSDLVELQIMMKSALAHRGPVVIRYPRGVGGGQIEKDVSRIKETDFFSRIVKRGTEGVLLAVGPMVDQALEVAQRLSRHGKGPTVVDVRSIKPLDKKTLGRLISEAIWVATLEENSLAAGFGEAIASFVSDEDYAARLLRIGLPDAFIEHGKVPELRDSLGLTTDKIYEKIIQWKNR